MSAGDQSLGPYRLLRLLGRGASATVHLAQDSRDGGWVALKTLDPGWLAADRDEAWQRFRRETAIVQRLRHPDIVAMLDSGENGGRLWLAMELANGVSLARYTEPRWLLPPALVLALGARIAQALAHAHAAGVVHRDIKPSNVIVELASHSLKLTDFGTSRLLDGFRTRTELLLGSPAYMAPELLAGEIGDARCDLYSLGVLLFELFTGQRPFGSASMGELLRQVANEPAPAVATLRPALPLPLSQAVALLLAKRADQRPPGAAAVAQQLQALQAQWPTAAGAEKGSTPGP